jgi:hypothetical protein
MVDYLVAEHVQQPDAAVARHRARRVERGNQHPLVVLGGHLAVRLDADDVLREILDEREHLRPREAVLARGGDAGDLLSPSPWCATIVPAGVVRGVPAR